MKLFDPRAALAEIQKQPVTPATSATSATQQVDPTPYVANVATPQAQNQKVTNAEQTPSPDDHRHGFAFGNRPKTWTGKVVSLEDWRALSEWDRHGPDGRHWNGKMRWWEEPSS